MNTGYFIKTVLLAWVLLCTGIINLYSGTVITDASTPVLTTPGKTGLEADIQAVADGYGIPFTNACLMGNLAGYPIASSVMEGFPHFLIGISFNTGLANMQYFDSEVAKPDNTYPAFSLAPAAFFGLGLFEKVDILGKLMLYSDDFYMPPLALDLATLRKINIYSFGTKLRYALIEKVTILPGIFTFGGVALSGGIDYMYGVIKIDGSLEMPFGSVGIDGIGEVSSTLDSNYSLEQRWYLFSGSSSAIAYANIFWIFSAYTGLGITINYGSVDLKFNSSSNVIQDSTSVNHGTLSISSVNEYVPNYLVPVYILGIELDLFLFKMSFETMVNLRNGSDINLQLGARVQF